MRNRLVTFFNDKDKDNSNNLKNSIHELPGIDLLKYPPDVYTSEIDSEIVTLFEKMRLIPTFLFVDPWGYKGLSSRLVNSVVKDWGCDCVFFFNYNRINMGLNNDMVREHMDALFGLNKVVSLRERLIILTPIDREKIIIEAICDALRDLGPKFILPFRFKDESGSRTSHFIIFVSKSFKGYEIMKEIMAKESSKIQHGVANFEYNPDEDQMASSHLIPLFPPPNSLDELGEMLLDEYTGRTELMKDIYLHHSVNRPYIKKNYKEALLRLENGNKITASPHRPGTFGDNVSVAFLQ